MTTESEILTSRQHPRKKRQAHEKMECLIDVKEPAVEAAVNDGEREVNVENLRLCVCDVINERKVHAGNQRGCRNMQRVLESRQVGRSAQLQAGRSASSRCPTRPSGKMPNLSRKVFKMHNDPRLFSSTPLIGMVRCIVTEAAWENWRNGRLRNIMSNDAQAHLNAPSTSAVFVENCDEDGGPEAEFETILSQQLASKTCAGERASVFVTRFSAVSSST